MMIERLKIQLQEHADPRTKAWWEGYVKHSAPFIGVKMPVIRKLLHAWHAQYIVDKTDLAQQFDLALSLFAEPHTEEKLAGTLFLQEILLPAGVVDCRKDIEHFAGLFREGHIYDWNVCDWFCVKVLGPLIQMQGEGCAEAIALWRTAENLWQARAALVPFTKAAGESQYYGLVEETCRVLIRREERFAKTAVGWVLRDISKHDAVFVKAVIDANIAHFSTESLRNAVRYFKNEESKETLQRLQSFRKSLKGV